eukprot:3392558-Pyramimonas_sp.AAC.1
MSMVSGASLMPHSEITYARARTSTMGKSPCWLGNPSGPAAMADKMLGEPRGGRVTRPARARRVL